MEEEKQEELIEPLRITEQLTFRMLANMVSSFKCDKWLDLIHAIKFMLKDPQVGHQYVKEHYGDQEFYKKIKKLDMAHFSQLKIKPFYETLSGKNITDKDIHMERFQMFNKFTKETLLINWDLIDLFYTLYKELTLKDRSIPAEAFAQAYRMYKSFEVQEEEQKIREEAAKEEIPEEFD